MKAILVTMLILGVNKSVTAAEIQIVKGKNALVRGIKSKIILKTEYVVLDGKKKIGTATAVKANCDRAVIKLTSGKLKVGATLQIPVGAAVDPCDAETIDEGCL